jgi:hypothetical protein
VPATTPDLPRHDSTDFISAMPSAIARLGPPDFPTPIGVFRKVSAPTFENRLSGRMATDNLIDDPALLDDILNRSETWTVP